MAHHEDTEFENAMSIMKLLTSPSQQIRHHQLLGRRHYEEQQQQHSGGVPPSNHHQTSTLPRHQHQQQAHLHQQQQQQPQQQSHAHHHHPPPPLPHHHHHSTQSSPQHSRAFPYHQQQQQQQKQSEQTQQQQQQLQHHHHERHPQRQQQQQLQQQLQRQHSDSLSSQTASSSRSRLSPQHGATSFEQSRSRCSNSNNNNNNNNNTSNNNNSNSCSGSSTTASSNNNNNNNTSNDRSSGSNNRDNNSSNNNNSSSSGSSSSSSSCRHGEGPKARSRQNSKYLSSADDEAAADIMETQEPSDCKSPKQEGRMVSPSSCMPVLPLSGAGGGGEGTAGSAHLQAATSTTPEAGSGTLPHNFLMDVHGPGTLGASPSSHMKQEIGGAAGGGGVGGGRGGGGGRLAREWPIPGSSIQAKLCQVCSDNASGFHYGVWSCEGCKAFFKRSIQGPVDYICPATNTCTIDKHRRKSCQACRLRRCYEVGMNKGSQRKEKRNSGNTSSLKGKRCRADSSDSAVNSTNNGASSSKSSKRSRSASILEALQKADLPVMDSYHNHNLPATRVHLLNTLIKLADRELVYLINWAKHVPGYTCLTLGDQVHLIECCWMELLLLNCAFRSMEHEGRTLVFAPDFHLERQQWALTGMGDVLEQVSAVSEQMLLHGLNKEELLLLQATVLVNAEVRPLDSFLKIQEMRQLILDVFMEVAGRHQGFGNWRHAPSILLLLTHIRQAGERGITYFQKLKMEGCVTFCDLLTEMLDAHNSSGERRRLQQQQHPQQQQQPPAHHHHHHHQQPPPPQQQQQQQQPPPPPPPPQHQQQQHPSQHQSHHPHPGHPQQTLPE